MQCVLGEYGAGWLPYVLAQGRYEVGVGPLIDVTDAQLAFTQAESQYIQALVNFKRAEARLRKATGVVE